MSGFEEESPLDIQAIISLYSLIPSKSYDERRASQLIWLSYKQVTGLPKILKAYIWTYGIPSCIANFNLTGPRGAQTFAANIILDIYGRVLLNEINIWTVD